MLPEEHKTAIITNGLHFLRSITEAYGAEQGMELWETIANTLDPDVKGQIFFAMITGTYNDRIHLRGITRTENAVACIKEIRRWSGNGLKEAKDIYDSLRGPRATDGYYLKVEHEDYHRAVAGFRNVGFLV